MCVKLPRLTEPPEEFPEFMRPLSRRSFATGALALGAAGLLGLRAPAAAARSVVANPFFPKRIHDVRPYDPNGTSVVILGAGGGPDAYYLHGTAVAIVSHGSVYLVDFGIGMHRQFMFARLHPAKVRAAFLSHLHSDHMHDVYPFFSTSYYYFYPPYVQTPPRIAMYGPGSAAQNAPAGTNGLPPGPFTIDPTRPSPGLADVMRSFVEGPYAYDNNLRARDEGMPDLLGLTGGTPLLDIHELPVPAGSSFEAVALPMDPIEVYEDENVRVTAILVDHAPVFPSYAYRFDTREGSVTISGDTAASANLIRLAHRTDLLVHEVIHVGWLDWLVSQGAPPLLLNHLTHAHTADRDVDRPGLVLDGVGTVARKAEARRLALYHLVPTMDFDSQGRAFDIPAHEWEKKPSRDFGRRVDVGRDLMRIDLVRHRHGRH